MQWTYRIPLTPLPLQRARHCWRNLKPFDSQKEEKLAFGIYLQQQKPDIPPISKPIKLEAYFYFKIAESRKRQAIKENWDMHIFKPDISNLIKFVEDVAVDVGILRDDCIICSELAEKHWTLDSSYTVFTLTEL